MNNHIWTYPISHFKIDAIDKDNTKMLNNSTKQLESKDTNTKIDLSTDNSIYLVTESTVASDLEDFSLSTSPSEVLTLSTSGI